MRAQATAAGLVQLCEELRVAGLLNDAALERIKDSIANVLAEYRPRSMTRLDYLATVHNRLDQIFAGREPVGPLPTAFTPGAK